MKLLMVIVVNYCISIFIQQRRRLLKRSKGLTMDKADKVSGLFRNSLVSLPETEVVTGQEVRAFPNLPDHLLKGLTQCSVDT